MLTTIFYTHMHVFRPFSTFQIWTDVHRIGEDLAQQGTSQCTVLHWCNTHTLAHTWHSYHFTVRSKTYERCYSSHWSLCLTHSRSEPNQERSADQQQQETSQRSRCRSPTHHMVETATARTRLHWTVAESKMRQLDTLDFYLIKEHFYKTNF